MKGIDGAGITADLLKLKFTASLLTSVFNSSTSLKPVAGDKSCSSTFLEWFYCLIVDLLFFNSVFITLTNLCRLGSGMAVSPIAFILF